jgi:hypothetical protein
MKKIVKELAKEAGFIFWENEEWKPKGATIDWSCYYDKELERFFKLAVRYAESDRKFSKQLKCNLKELEKALKEEKK